jgi:uncharacterized protein YmfQ (DUF2313 family)
MPAQALIDRYRDRLLSLLPPGDAIAKGTDSRVYAFMEKVATEFARVDESVTALLYDFVPSRALNLIDEWEKSLGLPDTCFTPSTDDERRKAIVTRLVGTGGNSVADYAALAATLGYAGPVFTTYAPFRMGSRMGDRFTNGPWRSTALVQIESGLFDTLLECAFNHQKLAHETLLFSFVSFLTVDGEYVTVDGEYVVVS